MLVQEVQDAIFALQNNDELEKIVTIALAHGITDFETMPEQSERADILEPEEDMETMPEQSERADITQYWAMPEPANTDFYYDIEVLPEKSNENKESYAVVIEEQVMHEIEDAKLAYALNTMPDVSSESLIEKEHREWYKRVNRLWLFMVYDLIGL